LREFIEGTAARAEALAATTAGRAIRRDGIALADLNSPIFFDNTVVVLAPCDYLDRDAVFAAIGEFYPPERGVMLFSAFPTWDFSGVGFELMGHPPFMVRPAGGDIPPPPDDLEIRRVDSEAEAATFAATLAAPSAPAVLIASDDGVGVYERMGYIRLLRLTLWMRPGQ